MSENPWHKRYHSDALAGYMGLTLEERGAYTTLLDLMYDRGEALVDNERLLAGFLGVSLRKYRAVRDALIAKGKIQSVDGKLTNSRFDKERENALKTSRKRAESGKCGGEKSAETRKNANKNNDAPKQVLEQDTKLYQKPEARSQNTADERRERVDLDALESRLIEAGGEALNRTTTGLVNLSPPLGWLDEGFDLELDIVPAIRAVAKRAQPGSIGSWSYFSGAVRDAKAARTKPAPEGKRSTAPSGGYLKLLANREVAPLPPAVNG